MKCYYEELGVDRDATEANIKNAYRKLALKWHPDKNLDSLEEAKERFLLIQQAYEVLSDPQERTWYDNHREQILRGKNSDYEDNCLDVFQYFTVTCFKGYGDDSKSFYAVYKDVFEKIAAEDSEFMDDEIELDNVPKFGDSTSSYDEVVGPFYAWWSAYCTKRTYTWLCPYDIKEIKDRRILREIEKDMKKIVQKAKKERNEEVRNLVSFVRKRDKRVQAYKKQLEERAAFNRQKQEQNRMEQIRRRQQELEEMRQNSKSAHSDDYEEQLKQLEQEYSSGDNEDEEDIEEDGEPIGEEQDDADGEEELYDDLYCVACNKAFKNENAFANHETSKKHRENIGKLKLQMREEESLYQPQDKESEEEIDMENNAQEGIGEEVMHNSDGKELEVDVMPKHKTKFPKSRNKKDYKKSKLSLLVNSDEDNENVLDDIVIQASKLDIAPDNDENDEWDKTIRKHTKKSKNKNKNGNGKNKVDFPEAEPSKKDEIKNLSTKPTSKTNIECMSNIESDKTQHICVTCKSHFESKNKLFSHLKLSNHGVYIPKTKKNDDEVGLNKKGKGKKK